MFWLNLSEYHIQLKMNIQHYPNPFANKMNFRFHPGSLSARTILVPLPASSSNWLITTRRSSESSTMKSLPTIVSSKWRPKKSCSVTRKFQKKYKFSRRKKLAVTTSFVEMTAYISKSVKHSTKCIFSNCDFYLASFFSFSFAFT